MGFLHVHVCIVQHVQHMACLTQWCERGWHSTTGVAQRGVHMQWCAVQCKVVHRSTTGCSVAQRGWHNGVSARSGVQCSMKWCSTVQRGVCMWWCVTHHEVVWCGATGCGIAQRVQHNGVCVHSGVQRSTKREAAQSRGGQV